MTESAPKPQVKFEIPDTSEQADELLEANGVFSGNIAYWTLDEESVPRLQHKDFTASTNQTLAPFRYKKPTVEDDPFNPTEEWEPEDKTRAGYVPLTIVENAYRGPNHWHRADDAVACAVQNGNTWETRFFPKGNISPETWREATEMLNYESEY